MLGPVALRRAWYHCADCGHGLAPRDDELGVAGTSLSLGLAAMNDLATAAGPFAGAARLLEKLAGVRLTARRVERAAEASGTALAGAGRERAALGGRLEIHSAPGQGTTITGHLPIPGASDGHQHAAAANEPSRPQIAGTNTRRAG